MAKKLQSHLTRRAFVTRVTASATAGLVALRGRASSSALSSGHASKTVDVGSRLELFLDDHLIDRLGGAARLQLHHPTPREIVVVHDAPWEGCSSVYHSVFKDGNLYRMYYRGSHLVVANKRFNTGGRRNHWCYAESDDGIHWRKPSLGLFEFKGSKDNNILFADGKMGALNVDAGHVAVFKDENPEAAADARYKAIALSPKPLGVGVLRSPDGIHWQPMSAGPVITQGAFDSQNLAFWDPIRKEYRAYWRIFTGGVTNDTTWKPSGTIGIRTGTSKDLLHWSDARDLTYVDSPDEHLYTAVVKPYHRAPHIFVGFPARWVQSDWSPSWHMLPEREDRERRAEISNPRPGFSNTRYGTSVTEGVLMSSRDGVLFNRWNEAFLRPGIERPGTWNYGHQYMAWHAVETRSDLAGAPNELSFYASESYWTGDSSELRRYTLRMDGFVSAAAPRIGGELVTKPLTFDGGRLHLNFSTSAVGWVKVEMQDAAGRPIPGFSEADADHVFGDTIERPVTWRGSTDVSALASQPVRMRFVLCDADVYAFQFKKQEP